MRNKGRGCDQLKQCLYGSWAPTRIGQPISLFRPAKTTRDSRCPDTANNRRTPSQSSSSKYRRTFFDERSRCFFMIIGTTGLDLAPRLEIKQLSERTGFRGVEVLLH